MFLVQTLRKIIVVDFDYSFQIKALIHAMEIGVFATRSILFVSSY